ncbi:Uncharacterised protein [Yersinia mollaretii]|uniref:hypothetical protein n=1 Tax=Yersinia mollaretii TaxID=33060 RepID=UPI0005E09824|nr:hypothetical protein [Yersinia mollaretii]CQJ12311.1 Uncharacterised protein [Yersinia mollaretii]
MNKLTEQEFTRKPDGGLADQIEVLEAMAEGDAYNTELLMLLIELLSLREQLAELKLSIGFNVGDRVCDSVDKFGYGYVVSINNGRSEYPISVQFDKSDKGRIATYTADGRKLSGCPVCLYKTPSVTAAKPAEE